MRMGSRKDKQEAPGDMMLLNKCKKISCWIILALSTEKSWSFIRIAFSFRITSPSDVSLICNLSTINFSVKMPGFWYFNFWLSFVVVVVGVWVLVFFFLLWNAATSIYAKLKSKYNKKRMIFIGSVLSNQIFHRKHYSLRFGMTWT